MLDRMIESQNNPAEKFRRGNFLLSTLFLVAMLLSGAMLYSLYAKPLGEMDENLELSSIVAPIVETDPPIVETTKNEPRTASNAKAPTETIRIVNQKSIEESTDIPKTISTEKNQYLSRPAGQFKLGNIESDAASNSGNSRDTGNSGNGIEIPSASTQSTIEDETKEPPKMPKVEPKPPQPTKTPSLGVVNGIAKNLPVPAYPAPAKAVHASGAVNVQITIDETGKVISAKAVSGHPLLRQAAEQAAQRAVFSPTLLSKVPVKATGVIVYNFVAQ